VNCVSECEEKAAKAGDIKKKHVRGRLGVVVHAAWAFWNIKLRPFLFEISTTTD